MNTFFSLVHLLTFHSFILLIHAQPQKYPLVFDPYTSAVYIKELPNSKNIQSITYPVLAACPAKSDEEKDMNENRSMDQKALFVREFYSEAVELDDMIRCENNFELAVAVAAHSGKRLEFMLVEFGYEVYFQRSVIPEEVVNYVNTTPYIFLDPIFYNRMLYDEPFLTMKKPLKFVWLGRIKMKFDSTFWLVKSLTYSMYRSANKIDVTCDDNNLGKQYYKGLSVDLEKYYSMENENSILIGVELPKQSTCRSTPNGCLRKYNLLMPHHFQSSPFSTVSCSDLTSIPIWYEVSEKLLNFSEKFLTAISEIASQKLTVISGGYQTLSLKFKNPITKKTESKDIYLDKDLYRFSVPRIIYKIVSYQTHDCDRVDDLCWFDMVIVIHNEPKITKPKVCKEDKCKIWGWESIQYLSTTEKKWGTKSPFIYCCELNPGLKQSLGYEANYQSKNLNLKLFPYDYDKNKKEIKYKNMQTEFEGKMEELIKQ